MFFSCSYFIYLLKKIPRRLTYLVEAHKENYEISEGESLPNSIYLINPSKLLVRSYVASIALPLANVVNNYVLDKPNLQMSKKDLLESLGKFLNHKIYNKMSIMENNVKNWQDAKINEQDLRM